LPYGANMNHKAYERCMLAEQVCEEVFLEGHKIIYDGYSDYMRRRARANVISSEGGVVWGVCMR